MLRSLLAEASLPRIRGLAVVAALLPALPAQALQIIGDVGFGVYSGTAGVGQGVQVFVEVDTSPSPDGAVLGPIARIGAGFSVEVGSLGQPPVPPNVQTTWSTEMIYLGGPSGPMVDAVEIVAANGANTMIIDSKVVPAPFGFAEIAPTALSDPFLLSVTPGFAPGTELAWGQPIDVDIAYDASTAPAGGILIFARPLTVGPGQGSFFAPGAFVTPQGSSGVEERRVGVTRLPQSPSSLRTNLFLTVEDAVTRALLSQVLVPIDVVYRDAPSDAAVPLPPAAAMLLLGLAGLGALRTRRRAGA